MSSVKEIQQFETVIRETLNSWFEESDLEVEELASAAVKALEDWLDEPTVEFESDDRI
jgi:hypothetical protein